MSHHTLVNEPTGPVNEPPHPTIEPPHLVNEPSHPVNEPPHPVYEHHFLSFSYYALLSHKTGRPPTDGPPPLVF
jgi:hypothetical protein